MTGEEAYNQDFLYVLNKIQKQLRLEGGFLIRYRIEATTPISNNDVLSPRAEQLILKQLITLGVFDERHVGPDDLDAFDYADEDSRITFMEYRFSVNREEFKKVFEDAQKEFRRNKSLDFKKPSFSPESGILHFQGKEIEISKTKNSDPYYLLRTIFKEPTKLWNNDEILDDWSGFGINLDDAPKKKVYYAGLAVNNKVAAKTMIEDFLDATTKTIKIKEKYL